MPFIQKYQNVLSNFSCSIKRVILLVIEVGIRVYKNIILELCIGRWSSALCLLLALSLPTPHIRWAVFKAIFCPHSSWINLKYSWTEHRWDLVKLEWILLAQNAHPAKAQKRPSPLQALLSDLGCRTSSAAHTDWSTACRGTQSPMVWSNYLLLSLLLPDSLCLQLVWDRTDTLTLMLMRHLRIFSESSKHVKRDQEFHRDTRGKLTF